MMRIAAFSTALILGVSLSASCAQAQEAEGPISILNTAPLVVSGQKGENSAEAKFSVLNTSTREVSPTVTFQAVSDERVNVRAVAPKRLRPGEARILTVALSPIEGLTEAVTGQIVIAVGGSRVAQSVEVDPAPPENAWPPWVIGLSFLIAVLAAALVIWRMGPDRPRLWKAAPNPKWSYSSWATTLTAAGAAFGTVLGAATFPSFPEEIGKSELVNLNILFGVIVLVGPFLFETLRSYSLKRDLTKPERTGTNFTMVIASAFTLWAVIGQIAAFALLGRELLGGGFWAWFVAVVTLLFVLLACWYFFSTTSEQARRDWEEEEKQKKKEEEDRNGYCPKPEPLAVWRLL